MIITAYDSIKNIINGEKIFEGKKVTLVVKPIKLLLLNKLIKELLET
jgi:hypothetical protein